MTASIKKLGLFGGTFNPIHNGHLKVAQEVRQHFSLDKILFIPSYLPPHKPSRDVASSQDRLRMVELAIDPFPHFEASSLEAERAETSYSIMTLQIIKKIYSKARIYFLVGVDAFLEIKTWKDYKMVLASCSFIVVSRPGFHLEQAIASLEPEWRKRIVEIKEASQKIREKEEPQIILFPIEALDISSTDIRRRLQRGEAISGLVPEAVEKYIIQRNLYGCKQ